MRETTAKILVVEDSDTQRTILSNFLKNNHFIITEAKNGAEALEISSKAIPDLIISDILMPVMDGYEMVRNLKQNERLCNIPIIFYTSEYHELEAQNIATLFGSAFLSKTASKKELLKTINQALSKVESPKLTKQTLEVIAKKHLDLINNKLYERVQELEQLNVELEQRIAQRTQELEILNKKLYEESSHDSLSGLFNRRTLDEFILRELARANRQKTNLWVIMVDIDHFKEVNDQFGHHAGDLTLSSIANYLKHSLRAEDIVCRYGGDEFIMLFPDVSKKDIQSRLELMRTEIADLKIKTNKLPNNDNDKSDIHTNKTESSFEQGNNQLPSITVSIGAAINSPQNNTVDSLIHAADNALYLAKKLGRNRVVIEKNTNQVDDKQGN